MIKFIQVLNLQNYFFKIYNNLLGTYAFLGAVSMLAGTSRYINIENIKNVLIILNYLIYLE